MRGPLNKGHLTIPMRRVRRGSDRHTDVGSPRCHRLRWRQRWHQMEAPAVSTYADVRASLRRRTYPCTVSRDRVCYTLLRPDATRTPTPAPALTSAPTPAPKPRTLNPKP